MNGGQMINMTIIFIVEMAGVAATRIPAPRPVLIIFAGNQL
jgi:hypothetical protein